MHPRASDRPTRLPRWGHALAAVTLTLLAACGSTPRSGVPATEPPSAGAFDLQRDGAPANPPPDLITQPDPEPRIEPIRAGGPNKPYEVAGQRYTPLTTDTPLVETGLASWYGRKFHGRPTSSGEIFDMYASSAAHRTMPIPSYAQVRNPANGREVVVRVNDRGPFHSDRVVDLSYAAALKLGVLRGVTTVEVRRLTYDDIRSGRWGGETAWAQAEARPPPPPPQADATVAATGVPAPGSAAAPLPAQPEVAAAMPAPAAAAAPGFWVQLGAFRQPQGAHELREMLVRELAWLEPWLAIFDDRALFRLQAGPYATRSEAQGTAERIRSAASSVQTLVLQRR
jgi:rare lipoprotein A